MIAAEFDIPDLSQQLNAAGASVSHIDYDRLLKVCATLIRNDLKANMKAGRSPDGQAFRPLKFPRPNGTSSPLWDSGFLARSLGSGAGHVEQISGDTLILGTNVSYARLMQEGGTITPQRAKWLAIPLTAKAKRSGSPRDFSGELQFVPLGRNKAGLREKRQQKGRGKRKTKLDLQYLLVKKADVPARPFVGFSAELLTQIENVVAKHIAA